MIQYWEYSGNAKEIHLGTKNFVKFLMIDMHIGGFSVNEGGKSTL